jgi:hypothetical protein
MKHARLFTVIAASLSMFSTSFAETMRPLMSRENRMPDQFQLEVGSQFYYSEFDEHDSSSAKLKRHEATIEAFARFGLLENLSVYAAVPYGFNDSDLIGKHNGIKDVRAGIELLAYEHTFEYPYVIPYAEVRFPTGDEDKGLGADEWGGVFGAAIGTTMYDVYHYVLDGRYDYSQTGNKSEGLFGAAAAFIWDLSDRFSLLAEAKVTEKPDNSEDDVPFYFSGGMCYEATKNLSIYWYGGSSINTDENGSGSIKVAYRF